MPLFFSEGMTYKNLGASKLGLDSGLFSWPHFLLLFLPRWTRREEADFYRVVSTFGVIFDPVKHQFDWNQFRAFARLDKKSDESLEKYFNGFVNMCRRVCRMPVKPDDGKFKLNVGSNMSLERHC